MPDSLAGIVLLCTLIVPPIVFGIAGYRFKSVPTELEREAQVDGNSISGAYSQIFLPLVVPGMVAFTIVSMIL